MKKKEKPFWETKKLSQMTDEEWESLCDCCGKCCLLKVKYFFTHFTKIACPLLNVCTGKCKDYENRWDTVPVCIKLTPKNLNKHKNLLPKTCAYLWLKKYKTLPPWHPLVTGKKDSVHKAGVSVKNRAIPYCEPESYGDYIVKWDDL